jgi:hypothetical protein
LRIYINILLLVFMPVCLHAQLFAPAAGQPGTTAIPADCPFIISWADSCRISRGPAIITTPDSLVVTQGEPGDATGKAGEGRVVSLGDGGSAVLYFNDPLPVGPGPDFAVFENAFSDAFLELAFVEVSSDGSDFFRFDAISLTPTDVQIGTYGSLLATNIHNLAGKYRAGYGTPFDLEELGAPAGLNMADIHWIRVTDVIGIIDDQLGSKDANGHIINDPWPTPFTSGGFDLDAVAAVSGLITSADDLVEEPCRIENSLCNTFLKVNVTRDVTFRILDMQGRIMLQGTIWKGDNMINTSELPAAAYIFLPEGQMPSKIIKTGKVH